MPNDLSHDLHYAEHSKSLLVHANFLEQFADLVHQAALVWYREKHKLPASQRDAAIYLFLGKHSKASCEAFRRSYEDSHNLSSNQLKGIVHICREYIDELAFYPDLDKDFMSYDTINRIFDARSHRGRGPKIVTNIQLSRCFDEMLDASSYKINALIDREVFIGFVEKFIRDEALKGDFNAAIKNCRSIVWKITEERRKVFYALSDSTWGFYIGYTLRYGFHAAQRCEDYFNMNVFLSTGFSAEKLFQEKYLKVSLQYMLMHQYGLKTGLHNKWNSSYAATALQIIQSDIQDGSPAGLLEKEHHNRVNAAMEKIRNGGLLTETYPDIFGSKLSLREIIKNDVDALSQNNKNTATAHNTDEIVIVLANYAEAEFLQGSYDEAKQLLLDANSLLLVDESIRFAKARVLETLGIVENTLGNAVGDIFLRKARSIYTEIGAVTRASDAHSKIKKESPS